MPYSDQFVNIYPKTTTKVRKTTSLDKGYDYQNLYKKNEAKRKINELEAKQNEGECSTCEGNV